MQVNGLNSSTQNLDIIFFSDLHLTLKTINLAQKLFQKQLLTSSNIIIINGDFIDESIEYYTKNNLKIFLEKLNMLLYFISQKCNTLIWISGNHDEFFIKKYNKKLSKNVQITFENYFMYTSAHYKYLFLHGHQFDNRYIYHQILKYLPFKKTIRKHTKSQMKQIIPYSPPNLKKILKNIKKYNLDKNNKDNVLIFGHFHKEEKCEINDSTTSYQSKNWNFQGPLPLYAIAHDNSLIKLF